MTISHRPPRNAGTDSLRQRLDTARAEITRLRAEYRPLRDQLARHLGLQRAQHPGDYPKGIKISDRDFQNLEKQNVLRRHDFHGEWKYCLDPPGDASLPDHR